MISICFGEKNQARNEVGKKNLQCLSLLCLHQLLYGGGGPGARGGARKTSLPQLRIMSWGKQSLLQKKTPEI